MNSDVKNRLIEISDNKYSAFSTNIIPNAKNILGVRMPKLRAYAKELAKNPDVLAFQDDFYYEETLLRGMIIGYMKADVETRLQYISEFVPKIDNWGVCDSFCSTLKFKIRSVYGNSYSPMQIPKRSLNSVFVRSCFWAIL